MKKLIRIILLYSVLCQIKTIKMEIIGLPGDEINECDSVKKAVVEANKNTKILPTQNIIGEWVSEKCESRSGPKFVLRKYKFFPDETFQLTQFYFDDESCSSVTYTIVMEGRYQYMQVYRSSPFSAAHIKTTLLKASIVAYDEIAASKLNRQLGKKCSTQTKPRWKLYREYLLFSRNERQSNDRRTPDEMVSSAQKVKDEEACLTAIDLSLDELKTVRIQSRSSLENGFRYELLLANTYYAEQELKTLRHKFQLPLVLLNGSTNCYICDTVAHSTNMNFRGLQAKAKLPPYVNGVWISERCETLSTGLFSMRELQLHEKNKTWDQRTSYYTDYTCSNRTMEHLASGSFELFNQSKRIPGSMDINFHIEKSFLTVFEEHALREIRDDHRCSVSQDWQLREPNEILSSNGCSSAGIVYSQRNYDIARLDLDYGIYLIYLGDEDSTNSITQRPISYKYPLQRCSRYVDDEHIFQTDSANTILMLPTLARALVIMTVVHVLLAVLK